MLSENDTDTRAVSEALGRDVGCNDGTRDGSLVGGKVGTFDGARVASTVGTLVGSRVGIFDGARVGSAVGTSVGTAVGGRVYSTTIVDVVTPELAVAFLLAVIFTPVTFALADTSAFVRFPLLAADEATMNTLRS